MRKSRSTDQFPAQCVVGLHTKLSPGAGKGWDEGIQRSADALGLRLEGPQPPPSRVLRRNGLRRKTSNGAADDHLEW